MKRRPRAGRDLPLTLTERHPLLAAAVMIVVLALLGVLLGRGVGTVSARVVTAFLDHVVTAG